MLMWLLWTILILLLLAVLSMMGRTSHKGVSALEGWKYAHRGLHGKGIPENSMAAFRASLEKGYGIELDVHLLKDGSLAVIHDSVLKRTTGKEGKVEDLTAADLPQYLLEGTEQTIPLFSDVLKLYDGKAPLIVELKTAGNNAPALCETVCRMMEGYRGVYCLESFDPRCVYWLKKHRPDIVRGQLTENFMKTGAHLPWVLRFALTHQLLNFMTMPDFIAYKYADRRTVSVSICRRLWKLKAVTWTLKTQKEFDTAANEGWIPIFEGFLP